MSAERRSWLMSRVKSKNTTLEKTVRALLFARGYRYRHHDKQLPGTPDIVFPGRMAAIFVNGCFWHGHTFCQYGKLPKSNLAFWQAKIEHNRTKDADDLHMLNEGGWKALTIWQCELKNIETLIEKLDDFLNNT
jgi:DNA mismatch endonuclease, patch repair protein